MTVFNEGDIVRIKRPPQYGDHEFPVTNNSICRITQILPAHEHTYPYLCEILFGETTAEHVRVAFADHEMEKLT